MRISDWSSDVCSSDLQHVQLAWQALRRMDGRSVDSARVDVAAQLLCRAWHAKGGRAYAHVHPRDDAGVTGHHPLFLGFRARDRKSVVQGKSVSVRVAYGGRRTMTKKMNVRRDPGGRSSNKKKNIINNTHHY